MTDKDFVTAEEISSEQNNIKTLVRFAASLTLLRKILLPTMLVIVFAAAVPSYFLWFVGELVGCGQTSSCNVTHALLGWEVVIPMSLSTLFVLMLLAMFSRIAAWMLFELSGQWSTQKIQADMMLGISGVRTTFFDENPSGRLINRLLGDYGMLRQDGVVTLGDTASGLAEVLCVGVLIMLASPIAGAMILPVICLYVGLQAQLAPMMSHAREIRAVKIGEALHRQTDLIEGRTIFTLYNRQRNLLERIHKAFGESMNIQLFYCRLMRWGMLWMGLISAAYAALVYTFLVYGLHAGIVSTTLAAVIITAVFNLNNTFFGLAWELSYLGEVASHARRAFFMIDLPHESTQESSTYMEESSTYMKESSTYMKESSTYKDESSTEVGQRVKLQRLTGDIEFVDYGMSYRVDLPRILDGLSVTIPAGKKVGIIGRTGAGKSSMMQALFRMVYHQAGDICIGGQSIYGFDVNCVRSHFGVVPQDPYLFAGSIRFNLAGDLRDVTDSRLREVLGTVGLSVDLNAVVLEGGRDYSVGERQLLCIARLILHDKDYILMDEPTSSLDRKTDEQIQQLMRTVLADKTVITIAHRLESLEQYDLVLEMAQGKLLRQGTPAEMLDLIGATPDQAVA
ncbi:MAG: ABC-type multidrug transport system fused ATPase/permease subunit [Crocinitomicaceae bacterium]|jgi:ABC-type multidrug transport system fused ATPase/permease subunit